MKKKYIITGLLVFIFSAIAIYLVLDNKKETYAVENCPPTTNIQVYIGSTITDNILQAFIISNMTEDCCKNTLGWSIYAANDDDSHCKINITESNGNYYYHSISEAYCAVDEGYVYNQNNNRCEKMGTTSNESFEARYYKYQESLEIDKLGYVIIDFKTNDEAEITRKCQNIPEPNDFSMSSGIECWVEVSKDDLSYKAPSSQYCAAEFTYNSSTQRCVMKDSSSGTNNTFEARYYKYQESLEIDKLGYVIIDFKTNDEAEITRKCQNIPEPNDFSMSSGIECWVEVPKDNPSYKAPSSEYCPSEFTYNSSTHKCVKNIESDPPIPEDPDPVYHQVYYKCSTNEDVTCNMFSPNFEGQYDTLEFNITSERPTRSGYTFLYWITATGKYHYRNSCSGVSDSKCRTKIKLKSTTTQVTLYAVWKKDESSSGGGSNSSSNTNPKLSYVCGTYDGKNIECDNLPGTQYATSAAGGTLKISATRPTDKSDKYVFTYWTHNPPKTYKYHSTCNGLSSCKTKIPITKNNTLYANWELKSGSSEPANTVYIKYRCGSYQDGDTEYDVKCENLPEDTAAVNGTGYISETIPTDKDNELEFWYWKSNYSGFGDASFCHSGCDKDRIIKMQNNNFLYAVWRSKSAPSTGNYAIEYLCSNNEKCSGISNTTGTKPKLTITEKIPTKEGYIFLYWEPLSEYDDSKLYCNPSNRLDFDCYQTMTFEEEGTVKVKAVWMEEDEEDEPVQPNEPSEKTSTQQGNENNEDNPQTGITATYIAIILCLAMLGYSYYYFRKAKNN